MVNPHLYLLIGHKFIDQIPSQENQINNEKLLSEFNENNEFYADKLVESTSLFPSKVSHHAKPKISLYNIYQKPSLNESEKSILCDENFPKHRVQPLNFMNFRNLKDFLNGGNLQFEENEVEDKSFHDFQKTSKNIHQPIVEKNLFKELLQNDSLTIHGDSKREDHRRFFEKKKNTIHRKMIEITNKSKTNQNDTFITENSDKNKDKSSFSIGNPKNLFWNESFNKNLIEDEPPILKRPLINDKWLNIFDNPHSKPLEYFLNIIEDKSQSDNIQPKSIENKESILESTQLKNKSKLSGESKKAKEKKVLDFLNTFQETSSQTQKSTKASICKKRKELLRDLDRNFYRNEDIILGNSILLGDTDLTTSRTIRTFEERRSVSNRKKKIKTMTYKYKNMIENMIVNKKIHYSMLNQSMTNGNTNKYYSTSEHENKKTMVSKEDDDVPLNCLYDKLKIQLNHAKMALTDEMFEEYEQVLRDEEKLKDIRKEFEDEVMEDKEVEEKSEFANLNENCKEKLKTGNFENEEKENETNQEILKQSFLNEKPEKIKKNFEIDFSKNNNEIKENNQNANELKNKFSNFWDDNSNQEENNKEDKSNHIIEKLKNIKTALGLKKDSNKISNEILPLQNLEKFHEKNKKMLKNAQFPLDNNENNQKEMQNFDKISEKNKKVSAQFPQNNENNQNEVQNFEKYNEKHKKLTNNAPQFPDNNENNQKEMKNFEKYNEKNKKLINNALQFPSFNTENNENSLQNFEKYKEKNKKLINNAPQFSNDNENNQNEMQNFERYSEKNMNLINNAPQLPDNNQNNQNEMQNFEKYNEKNTKLINNAQFPHSNENNQNENFEKYKEKNKILNSLQFPKNNENNKTDMHNFVKTQEKNKVLNNPQISQNNENNEKEELIANPNLRNEDKFEKNKDQPRQKNVKQKGQISLNLIKAKSNSDLTSLENQEKLIKPMNEMESPNFVKNKKIHELEKNLLSYSPISPSQRLKPLEPIRKLNDHSEQNEFSQSKPNVEKNEEFGHFEQNFNEENFIETNSKKANLKNNMIFETELKSDNKSNEKCHDEDIEDCRDHVSGISNPSNPHQDEIFDGEKFHSEGQFLSEFRPISFSPIKSANVQNDFIETASKNNSNNVQKNIDFTEGPFENNKESVPIESEKNIYKTLKNYQSSFKNENENFNEIENFIMKTDEKYLTQDKKPFLLNSQAKECQTDKSAIEMQELIDQMKFYKMDITLLTKPKFANYEELNEEEDGKTRTLVNKIFKKIAKNLSSSKNSFHSSSNVSKKSGFIQNNLSPFENNNKNMEFDESIKCEVFNAAQKIFNSEIKEKHCLRNIYENSSNKETQVKTEESIFPQMIIDRLFPKIEEENNLSEQDKSQNSDLFFKKRDIFNEQIHILFANLEKMQIKRNLDVFFTFKQNFNFHKEKNKQIFTVSLHKIFFLLINQYQNFLKLGFSNIKNLVIREKMLYLGRMYQANNSKIELMTSTIAKKLKKNMKKGFKKMMERALFLKKKEEKMKIYGLNLEMLKKKILKKLKLLKLHSFGKIKEFAQFNFFKYKNSIYLLHLLFEQKKPKWLSYGFWQLKKFYITKDQNFKEKSISIFCMNIFYK